MRPFILLVRNINQEQLSSAWKSIQISKYSILIGQLDWFLRIDITFLLIFLLCLKPIYWVFFFFVEACSAFTTDKVWGKIMSFSLGSNTAVCSGFAKIFIIKFCNGLFFWNRIWSRGQLGFFRSPRVQVYNIVPKFWKFTLLLKFGLYEKHTRFEKKNEL